MIKVRWIIAAVMAVMPVPSLAQSYLSDATVCKRALKEDRTGWVEDSDYSKEAERRGLTFRACNEMQDQPADTRADEQRMRFIEAGIFFITGFEPPDIEIQSNTTAIYERHQIRTERGYATGRMFYQIQDDQPCTIFGYFTVPPYGIIRMDFNNLPSPRAASVNVVRMHGREDVVVRMELPHETKCTAQSKPIRDDQGRPAIQRINGTSMCDSEFVFHLDSVRRLKALDYIRKNYCAGQPEPPPKPTPPRKPY